MLFIQILIKSSSEVRVVDPVVIKAIGFHVVLFLLCAVQNTANADIRALDD